ncbi:MAG: class I SAM-dependent methyltransferase [Actinobacteria bacterium]|nr:class I SAM-dependent methyltransferase [Actinomycetota bacterium]
MLRQLKLASSLAFRDPRLLWDYVRWMVEGRLEGRKRNPAMRRGVLPNTLTIEEGLALITTELGAWSEGPALRRIQGWRVDPDARWGGGSEMAGDSALGHIVYAVVRATRPDVVVETGVATGMTSAYLLAALEDNGHGALHSIDLPPTDMVAAGHVGAAIPADLNARWTYHWGSSRRLLPKVLGATQGRLVFVHDSDHSYANMSWEIRAAWQRARTGDVIVSDDVDLNSAFLDTARDLHGEPWLIAQAEKAGTTGLLRRT